MSENRDLRQEIIDLYRARAGNYDFTANLYYLVGYPEWAHRRRAVNALALESGTIVVEIGCGTGLNFSLLQQAVGPTGKIVGVDLTDAMLRQARQRVRDRGWNNVELVHSDALRYDFAPGVDGIISTYALSLIPECDEVICRGAQALRPGGRWVVLDLKLPDRWPEWLSSLLLPLVRPFAVTDEWLARRPWETIKWAVDDCLTHVSLTEMYLGLAYLLSGVRKGDGQVA
jgi:demethylmenaquinone methyltransferase/2-methoxy-6-polyprenyl-1,4-benzoquinol methylase